MDFGYGFSTMWLVVWLMSFAIFMVVKCFTYIYFTLLLLLFIILISNTKKGVLSKLGLIIMRTHASEKIVLEIMLLVG